MVTYVSVFMLCDDSITQQLTLRSLYGHQILLLLPDTVSHFPGVGVKDDFDFVALG